MGEEEANSDLIALAPEMEDVLREDPYWCEQDAQNEDGHPTQEMLDNRVKVPHAALKKVSGNGEDG